MCVCVWKGVGGGGGGTRFSKLLIFFVKTFTVPVILFSVTSLVSKTSAYLALVLRLHHAMHMIFTVGFQYNFRQIVTSFSAGRR